MIFISCQCESPGSFSTKKKKTKAVCLNQSGFAYGHLIKVIALQQQQLTHFTPEENLNKLRNYLIAFY